MNSAIRELLFHALSSMDSADLGVHRLDTPLTRIAAALRLDRPASTVETHSHPISQAVRYERQVVCRDISEQYGAVALHFIRIVRLTKARAMLETRQGSVKEIALTTGNMLMLHASRATIATIFSATHQAKTLVFRFFS